MKVRGLFQAPSGDQYGYFQMEYETDDHDYEAMKTKMKADYKEFYFTQKYDKTPKFDTTYQPLKILNTDKAKENKNG